MKQKLQVLIIAVMVIIAGCQKEKAESGGLNGKWELRSMTGIQVAGVPPDFKSGNGHILEFTTDQYQRTEQGKSVTGGKYSIVNAAAEFDGISYKQAILYENSDLKHYFNISENKLTVSIGPVASDGYTAVYERL